MCNAMSFESDHSFSEPETGGLLAWLLLGVFVTIGYSIPFELWRGGILNPVGMGLTMGGGTIILLAVLGFVFSIKKTESSFF